MTEVAAKPRMRRYGYCATDVSRLAESILGVPFPTRRVHELRREGLLDPGSLESIMTFLLLRLHGHPDQRRSDSGTRRWRALESDLDRLRREVLRPRPVEAVLVRGTSDQAR